VIEIRVPDEQEGTKAVVRAWLKRIGDEVRVNDPLVELETDKVTQEVPAPAAGVLSEILLDTDAEAVPGALLGRIDASGAPAKAGVQERENAAPHRPGPRPAPGNSETESRLSPSVKRACLQHGVDPSQITGTGRDGRVTREDVDRFVADGGSARAPVAFASSDIPHDRMRMKIAENMVQAVSSAPHATAVFEADFSAIAAHKKALAERGEELIGEDERSAIRHALAELREALGGDDHRLIRASIKNLDDAARHLAELIMDNAVLAALKDRKASEVAEG